MAYKFGQASQNNQDLQTISGEKEQKFTFGKGGFGIEKPKQEGATGVRGLAVGAGKGIISSLKGTSSLGEKILRKATGFEQDGPTSAEKLIPKGLTEAKGKAEKIGFGIEKGAEFLIPGGAATKGIRAISRIEKAGIGLPGVTGLAKTVGKGAIGAAETGGVRAIQTGGDVKETAEAAAFGAGGLLGAGAVAKGIGAGVKGLAKKTPTVKLKELTRNVRSLKNTFDRGVKFENRGGKRVEIGNPIESLRKRNLVPQVREGKVDAEEIIQKLRTELEGLAQPRAAALTASTKTVPFSSFRSDVIKSIRESTELRNTGQVNTTINKADNILKDFKKSFGDKISIKTVDDIRVEMNKKFDPDLNDTFRAIGDSARKQIFRLDKESRPTLQKEGEILSAKAFAEALNARPVTGGRLGGYFASVLGSIVGGSTQIPVVGPVLGALGGRALDREIRKSFFKVPGAKTAQKLEKAGEKIKTTFGRSGQ